MIPVIYIHFGNKPEHLLNSLQQALKFNRSVYLISDSQLKMDNIRNFNVNDYMQNVPEFENAYVHMSTNTRDFEIICIKRWIILNNFLKEQKIDVCYYSDSDVMIYSDLSALYQNYESFDAVFTLPEQQEPYRWTASACCSYWKSEIVNKFSEFIQWCYSDEGLELLKKKWIYHQENSIQGGICDMTLLYLFSKQINFFSLSRPLNGIVFDQNYLDGENYYRDEYETELNKYINRNVKKVTWKNGLPFALNRVSKETVQFAALTEYARYFNKKQDVIKNAVSLLKRVINKAKRVVSKSKPKSAPHGWFGDYKNWEEVEKECGGYDSAEILNRVRDSVLKVRNGEAVYERDSVLFDEIQYSQELIKSLKDSIHNHQLHVTDFGGSLGSTYFQHKTILDEVKDLRWAVVEQKHFVECGQKEIAIDHLKFYDTVQEALKHQANQVLLLSSVIPYFREPYALIDKMISYDFETIIIDRTAFIEGEQERITKQIVPEFIYKASYPAWFLNENKFIKAFSSKYDLVREFKSAFDPDGIMEDGKRVYRKGFYFKRKRS